MLLKLAMRNIRRSIRDYAIYFATLVLGVAMFYAFNSIGSQQVLFDANELTDSSLLESMFGSLEDIMGMFTGVIVGVLGFLILYSNSFLIRRRKREFGTYETLGMSSGQVSRVMLFETAIVGAGALAVGLLLGIAASQGLSFFTGFLFGTTIKNYQFVFSQQACLLTVGCFVGIFVLVALFNTTTMNRYKLVDLLQANSRNEKPATRNPWVCLVVFAISIGILAFAYQQLIESQLLMMDDPRFVRATICMFVGTLLFFWSLSGFATLIITHMKGFYLRGVRPFTVRQITSRINTAFLSLWATCVLLFFSITVFSCGMGLVNVFVGDIEKANPYDATIKNDVGWYPNDQNDWDKRAELIKESTPEIYAEGDEHHWDIASCLRAAEPELWDETVGKSAQLDFYEIPGTTYRDVLAAIDTQAAKDALGQESVLTGLDTNLLVGSISQLNEMRALTNLQPLDLGSDEFLLVNDTQATEGIARATAEARVAIDFYGTKLRCVEEIVDMQLENSSMLSSSMLLIVPDSLTNHLAEQGCLPYREYLNVMYADNGLTASDNYRRLQHIVASAQPFDDSLLDSEQVGQISYVEDDDVTYSLQSWPVTQMISGVEMMQQSGGLRMLITYLALYIGLVFLICTAAVLAIQQLTSIADSEQRYRALWRIGADARMLNRSLFAQVSIYFLAPLAVAICHSACAIGTMNDSLFKAFGSDVMPSIGLCVVLVVAIYGTYLAITYAVAKSMLKPTMKLG